MLQHQLMNESVVPLPKPVVPCLSASHIAPLGDPYFPSSLHAGSHLFGSFSEPVPSEDFIVTPKTLSLEPFSAHSHDSQYSGLQYQHSLYQHSLPLSADSNSDSVPTPTSAEIPVLHHIKSSVSPKTSCTDQSMNPDLNLYSDSYPCSLYSTVDLDHEHHQPDHLSSFRCKRYHFGIQWSRNTNNSPASMAMSDCDKKRKIRKLIKRTRNSKRKRKTPENRFSAKMYYSSSPVATRNTADDLKHGYLEPKKEDHSNENEILEEEDEDDEFDCEDVGIEEEENSELNMIMMANEAESSDVEMRGIEPSCAEKRVLLEMDTVGHHYESQPYYYSATPVTYPGIKPNQVKYYHSASSNSPIAATGASSGQPPTPTTTPPTIQRATSPSAFKMSCCRSDSFEANTEPNSGIAKIPLHDQSNQFNEKICYGCQQTLSTSPVIASVSGYHKWHINCLCCSECGQSLSQSRSCYIRNGRIYCKSDYIKLIKCSKCYRQISASDWVRRAGVLVYHLACFACDLCQRQLSTGEKFTIEKSTSECRLLCRLHFGIKNEDEPISGAASDLCSLDVDQTNSSLTSTNAVSNTSNGSSTNPNSVGNGSNSSRTESQNGRSSTSLSNSSKTKRVRTTFTEEQLSVLQANFQLDSNPDGQDLERIAALTGLSKRVTQVWFQNSRARQKKYMSKNQRHSGLLDPGSIATAQSVSLLLNGSRSSGMGGLWSPTSSTGSSNNGVSADNTSSGPMDSLSGNGSMLDGPSVNMASGASISQRHTSKWSSIGAIDSNASQCSESEHSSSPSTHM